MPEELELTISDIIQRTYNVKSFRLGISKKFDFKAGQYLIVTLNNNQSLTKPLSFSNSPTEHGYIEFTKKLTESEFSKILNGLKVGDRVKLRCPYGKFIYDEAFKKIIFLSGGIGITPIRSIAKYIVDKKLDTDMILFYGNRTVTDIVFKEDFDIMQREYPKLKVVNVLSQADETYKGRVGHINCNVIKEEAPDYTERKYYLCGPPAMVEAMRCIIVGELKLCEDCIITEDFKGYY